MTFSIALPEQARTASPVSLRHWWPRAALVAVAYYLAGRVGLAIAPAVLPSGAEVTLLWPPAGIALAALLRYGLRLWPAVAAGALALAWSGNGPLALGAAIAAGNTLGPVLGAWALQRHGFHVALDRRRDLGLLTVCVGALGMLVAGCNGAVWMAVAGSVPWADAPAVALHCWLGNAVGALIVGVPLLTCSYAAWQRATADWRWVPAAMIVLGTLAAALLAALAAGDRPMPQSPLFFLPHLLLCWLAARSGLFVASTTALLVVAGTVVARLYGIGLLPPADADQAAALLVGYACSLLAIPLVTTALTGELAANERRWHLALDASQLGVGEYDVGAGRIELSQRWLDLLGHATQSFGHDLPAVLALVHADDAAAVRRAFAPLRSTGATHGRVECRLRCGDGQYKPFELHAVVAERGPDGVATRVVCTARDISDAHAARERQAVSHSVFQHLHEGLLITDAQLRVVDVNPTFTEITGYRRAELLGALPPMLRADALDTDRAALLATMRAALAGDSGAWRGELGAQRRNGEPCLLQLSCSAVRDANGTVRNHVLAVADITNARRQLAQLQRQAHFDELTQLPNRVRLAQMLQAAMQTSRRDGSLLTVCYLDLDHFKPVNDRYGHDAGDRLLVELARRARRSLRSWAGGDDVVARIGGDEFVLLLRTATIEESRHAVERLLGQVCQPYALGVGDGPVSVTASIGATVFPLDGADAETLLRHADHAMYGAKQAGRNGYLFFDAERDRRTEARFVALGRVQEALDANEFCLHYQPKTDLRSATVLGVEALLRWSHPSHGVIAPAKFLPLIENTGLAIGVGNWVLQQGIDQLARWLGDGLDFTVSINVSARHLQEPLFAKHLAGLLARHPAVVAQRLIIEVLETAALADVDHTCELMEECRALGVRFALDDFGTGYSTFTYLKRLPIDMLKIDRSFVTHMLDDRHDLAIVEGVIGLSRTFGCSVVAEGVETLAQAERLIAIGCHVGQGHGIAAAMPAERVADWVHGYRGMGGVADAADAAEGPVAA